MIDVLVLSDKLHFKITFEAVTLTVFWVCHALLSCLRLYLCICPMICTEPLSRNSYGVVVIGDGVFLSPGRQRGGGSATAGAPSAR